MSVVTKIVEFSTSGNADVVDITQSVDAAVKEAAVQNGTVTIFSPSATSALTTIEFESGCIEDLRRLFNEVADPGRHYAHNARWGDGNGHSHVRASLLGPSLTIPFVDRALTLGTWQQIVFVDFDNRSRRRRIVAQIIGE